MGVAGPVAFSVTWWWLGRRRIGYDPVQQPISRLAATAQPTRMAMSAGMLAFSAGAAIYARDVRKDEPRASALLAANAVGVAGIAALPLDAQYGDWPHMVAAAFSYATLSLLPAVSGDPVTGVMTGVFLVASQIDGRHRGLWQRLGLSLGHSWIALKALGRNTSSVAPSGAAFFPLAKSTG
ncbi:MAG TPA: DUF998 domain-containing protein [Acidimicrobiales bacterium]|nr:DUF998 domain-containing protein [Acidimicrobiales bacterium]